MNWKRTFVHILLLLLGTVLGGFVPGAIRGFYQASSGTIPQWTYWLQALLVSGVTFLVFRRLARLQRSKTWAHAAVVWLGGAVITLLNIAAGVTIPEILLSLILFGIVSAAGTAWGLRRGELRSAMATE